LSSWHDLADQESTQGQSTRLWASHRLAENTRSLELCQQVCRAGRTGTIETSARSPAGASWNHHQKRAETERGCVRSTSRSGTARPRVLGSFGDFRHPHLLRLVLRTQPRSGGGSKMRHLRWAHLTFCEVAERLRDGSRGLERTE